MRQEIRPIDRPVVAALHTPMYNMHKYWARKPHNVIAAYISHFTQENELVLDPFMGSGVTVLEAVAANRRAIGVDIDPMSVFITRATGMPVRLADMEECFERLRDTLRERIYALYKTRCPECKQIRFASYVAWDTGGDPRNVGKPFEIWYRCPKCSPRRLMRKSPDKEDFDLLEEIDKQEVPYWYPQNRLLPNPRINVWEGETVADLFVKRALIGLSMIWHEVKGIGDPDVQLLFRFVFSASVAQASRLIAYRGGFSSGGPAWTVRGFWIPARNVEGNPWNAFENRFRKVLNGKREANERVGSKWRECERSVPALGEETVCLVQGTACDLSWIPDNSIDYIFTDPPYGDYVPYLEIHQMWSAWQGFSPRFEDEIIISDSPHREKDFEAYKELLYKAFAEMYRVLAPGRWLTVTFHNQKTSVWNALLEAAYTAGFEYINDVYELPAVVSARAQLAPNASLTGDIIINFKKPRERRAKTLTSDVSAEEVVVAEARQIIAERGNRATKNQIMRGVVHRLVTQGLMHTTLEEIEAILNRNFRRVSPNTWALPEEEPESLLDYVPLANRVEWIVTGVLATGPKLLDEVLVAVYRLLKNGRTPETDDVLSALRRVAVVSDRKWWLRGSEGEQLSLNLTERELPTPPQVYFAPGQEHEYFIRLLAKLGLEAGYNVWIGKTEQGRSAALRKLSLPGLEISGFDKQAIRIAEQIDVIWLHRRKIPAALFEVENTTKFVKGIRRMADLTVSVPHLAVRCFLIAPDGVEQQLVNSLQAPSVREVVQYENWYYILYSTLMDYIDHRLPGSKSRVEELCLIAKSPFANE